MKSINYLIVTLFFVSCINSQNDDTKNQENNINTDTIVYADVNIGVSSEKPWKYEWNDYISSEIFKYKKMFFEKDSVYIDDILKLCPNYYTFTENQKASFWTLLIASIAKFESNFDLTCRYFEGPELNNVYSEGLLQLSYGDETRYRNVLLSTEEQNIFDPEVNLRTGVVILSRQLEIRKKIFTDTYFYWSVLRNKEDKIIDFFKKNMAGLSICE